MGPMRPEVITRLKQLDTTLTTIEKVMDPEALAARIRELEAQAGDPSLWDDPEHAQKITSELSSAQAKVRKLESLRGRLDDMPVMYELAEEEGTVSVADEDLAELESAIESLEVTTMLSGEYDPREAVINIRSGAGGVDAADWAEMLMRMYTRWAEKNGHKVDVYDISYAEEAATKRVMVQNADETVAVFTADATVERALAERSGDVLVFLPGAREVDDVVSRLRGAVPEGVDVLPLHGRLPASAQDAALAPSPAGRRRVVVSTNVAESSLTVPGVRVVVDSTLAREPHLDVARSMSGLVTVGVSRAAGVQRAGRAGREGPGVVYRCCSPTDWARSPLAPTPEILSADLTGAALELAVWGVPDGAGLAWVDEPPAAALAAAREALERLGLAGADGVTPLGRAVAGLPAGVREARALLATAPVLGARQAAACSRPRRITCRCGRSCRR